LRASSKHLRSDECKPTVAWVESMAPEQGPERPFLASGNRSRHADVCLSAMALR